MAGVDKVNDKNRNEYLEENLGKNILPVSVYEESLIGTNPTEVLIYYKKGTSVSVLEECFLKTIGHYNLFSSRLIMIGDNKFALQYCKDGVVIKVLPPVEVAFDELNIDDIKKMMVHVQTLPGEPLLAITGIPIKDGILGGLSCSHAIGDGISLMLFLYAWGCIIEGNSFPLPSTQRLYKGDPVDFDKIDKTFSTSSCELNEKMKKRVGNMDRTETYSAKEFFSDEFLSDIKNKAKSENPNLPISNNQIMNAFLLKKYHDRILPDTDKIMIRTTVNLRDVHPDIEAFYIGNAHFDCVAEFTKDEINKFSIPQIAYRLKQTIANMRDEKYVKEILHLSEYGIEFKEDILKNRPPSNVEADILSSNLTHLNDLESLGLGSNVGSISYIGLTYYKTGFTMLKEKSGRIFAQITSRYPLV